MKYLTILSSNDLIYALGWTILHSLWQIAVVAIILGLVLVILKRNSSASRYYVSAGAMFVVLVLSVVTFLNEYAGIHTELMAVTDNPEAGVRMGLAENFVEGSGSFLQSTVVESFKSYFDRNLPLLVTLWNIGVMVLLLKLIGGLAYSQRLKSYRTSLLPKQWEKRIVQLSELVGIKKNIQLLESAIVKVPVLIGYFKPAILLPIGAIAGLSQDQVEAILIHELAHIKRNDYVINIFQSIIEVLFFFHPALWWISRNIRNERENACDDIALSINNNHIALAKALTNLEILNHKETGLVLAFTGNKGSLINRIKRIANQHKTSSTFKEGFISACILFASLFIMSFSTKAIVESNNNQNLPGKGGDLVSSIYEGNFVNNKTLTKPEKVETIDENSFLLYNISDDKSIKPIHTNDTIVEDNPHHDIKYTLNGVSYRLVSGNNNSIKKFFVDKQEIPKNNWDKYKKEIEHAFMLIKKHEKDMLVHDKEMETHDKEMEKHDAELKLHDKEIEKHEEEVKIHDTDTKLFEKEMAVHEEVSVFEGDMSAREEVLKERKAEHEKRMKEHKERRIEHEKRREEHKERRIEHEKRRKEHEGRRVEHEKKRRLIDELIEEMKKDKLIAKDATSYKISFTETNLLINGEEQTKKVFKKYKDFFDKKGKGQYKLEGDFNFSHNYKVKDKGKKKEKYKIKDKDKQKDKKKNK